MAPRRQNSESESGDSFLEREDGLTSQPGVDLFNSDSSLNEDEDNLKAVEASDGIRPYHSKSNCQEKVEDEGEGNEPELVTRYLPEEVCRQHRVVGNNLCSIKMDSLFDIPLVFSGMLPICIYDYFPQH